ncbi:3-phosphoserine/phosphohydroxythreonine transaminase [Deltaproteobacteria bacterium TL4]
MTSRVYNFSAGPAMLPTPVMEKVQQEFLDYRGLGASLIEISHRSKEFIELMDQTDALIKELANLPDNYKILYVHGGARMQFSAIPMNFIGRSASKKAYYVESGDFAKLAQKEAMRYGKSEILASSAGTRFDRIPEIDIAKMDQDAAYLHITSNNTIYGTAWQTFPDTGTIPLIADMTSEILSRTVDYSKFGVIYAGLQKNLGPSGMALVFVREDLLGKAIPETPTLLDYADYAANHSVSNTINTFAVYMLNLILQWMKDQGGVKAIEKVNRKKAALIYKCLDDSQFYKATVHKDHRSLMNATFVLPNEELLNAFVKGATAQGLYALKGHRNVGGVRASIYNAMPLEGVESLVAFMKEFERTKG